MNQLPLFEHDPIGLKWSKGFLLPMHQHVLVNAIDKLPWDDRMKRRVQQYGFEYRYDSGSLVSKVTEVPPILKELADEIYQAGLMSVIPNSAIINEYLPGQGISNHVDSGSFGEEITTVSLLSPVWFDIISPAGEKRVLDLFPGDVLVMSGASRHNYSHGISKRLTDDGRPRRRRISITFRSVTANPVTVDVI